MQSSLSFGNLTTKRFWMIVVAISILLGLATWQWQFILSYFSINLSTYNLDVISFFFSWGFSVSLLSWIEYNLHLDLIMPMGGDYIHTGYNYVIEHSNILEKNKGSAGDSPLDKGKGRAIQGSTPTPTPEPELAVDSPNRLISEERSYDEDMERAKANSRSEQVGLSNRADGSSEAGPSRAAGSSSQASSSISSRYLETVLSDRANTPNETYHDSLRESLRERRRMAETLQEQLNERREALAKKHRLDTSFVNNINLNDLDIDFKRRNYTLPGNRNELVEFLMNYRDNFPEAFTRKSAGSTQVEDIIKHLKDNKRR